MLLRKLSIYCMEEKSGVLVEKNIRDDETFYRVLFSPLHISLKDGKEPKVKREALLPKPDGREVSMFRSRYMRLEECQTIGAEIQMNGQTFRAIGSLSHPEIARNNHTFENEHISAMVIYSPMHGKDYVDRNINVYTNDPDVDKPAHVDLTYSIPFSADSDVKTKMRKYASSLAKTMTVQYVKYPVQEGC